MLKSTLMRLTAFGAVFGLISLAGLWLASQEDVEQTYTQTVQESATLDLVTLEHDPEELTAEPVVKLASLVVMTDDFDAKNYEASRLSATNTDDRLRLAKSLTEQQKFDEALDVIGEVKSSDKNDYAVKFLEARILSWAGKHYEAERTFKALVKDYPQDPDVAVSYGYLKLYQNDYVKAQRLFIEVLDNHPDYQDAKNGLKRASSR